MSNYRSRTGRRAYKQYGPPQDRMYQRGYNRAAIRRRRAAAVRAKRANMRTGGFINRYGPGQEYKFYDTSFTAAVIPVTGSITSNTVCDVAVGTGESQRVGRKICVKQVIIKGYAFLPDATDKQNTADFVKVVVYGDKQANGAAATIANLLSSADVLSFNNLQNSQRFKTLKSKIVTLHASGVGHGESSTPTTTTATGRGLRHFVMKVNLNAIIEFSGTGSGVSDLTSNNIGIYAISQAGDIQLEYKVRIRYTDV